MIDSDDISPKAMANRLGVYSGLDCRPKDNFLKPGNVIFVFDDYKRKLRYDLEVNWQDFLDKTTDTVYFMGSYYSRVKTDRLQGIARDVRVKFNTPTN